MVSSLWKAAAENDLNTLKELLQDKSNVDLEVKDHDGVTPLIQAIRNGHIDAVKELLDAGASPTNPSSQGPPESYTQDPIILEMLKSAVAESAEAVNGAAPTATTDAPNATNENYSQQETPANYDPAMRGYYYMPPPGPDGVYPGYAYMAPPPEGMTHMPPYYHPYPPHPMHHPQQQHSPQPPQNQQQPSQQQQQPAQPPANGTAAPRADRKEGNGVPNLPPADIARQIPCRYFPMCKYGPSCLFAHPAPPFFNGPPPPPAHYSYENMATPVGFPPGGYYPMPPHGYPHPASTQVNGGPSPSSASQSAASSNSTPLPSTVPQSIPPPVPYPIPFPHPSQMQPQMPHVPVSSQAPYHPPANGMYPPVSPTHHRHDSVSFAQQQQQHIQQVGGVANEVTDGNAQEDGASGLPRVEGSGRRSGFRRTSLTGGRKPPCLFFPTNKCRNGDQCRFPHIRPEDDPEAFGPAGFPPATYPTKFMRNSGKTYLGNGPANGRKDSNGQGYVNGNGVNKKPNGYPNNRSGSLGPRNGVRNGNGQPNGFQSGTSSGTHSPNSTASITKQRIPSADEFPSLNGSAVPTPVNGTHVNGNSSAWGVNGVTAAQVLKGDASKDVDKLTEGLSKVSLESERNGNGNIITESTAASPGSMSPPTFASISAPALKMVGAPA